MDSSLSTKASTGLTTFWHIARYVGQSIALILALVGASHYLGSQLADCGWQCKAVRELWFAPFFTFASIALPIIAMVSLSTTIDSLPYRRVALVQGALGLFAFALIAYNRWLCVVCISIQLVWLALAIESFKSRLFAVFAYALVLFGVANTVGQAADNAELAKFEPIPFTSRAYEKHVSGTTIVIFTDPLCTACRAVHQKLDLKNANLPVVYRWKLLPQHGDFSLRIACALESAWNQDFQKGEAFFTAIYRDNEPANDEDVVRRATKCGFDASTVSGWLKSPEAQSLQVVQRDGEDANQLQIDAVPSLAKTGLSTLGGQPKYSRLDPVALRALLNMPENSTSRGLSIFIPSSQQPNK